MLEPKHQLYCKESKYKTALFEERKSFWRRCFFAGHLLQCSSKECSYLWCGLLGREFFKLERGRLDKIVKKEGQVVGISDQSTEEGYLRRVRCKLAAI